jgi:hypothetical protein
MAPEQETTVSTIYYGLDVTAIFAGDGWENTDEEASAQLYREELTRRLSAAFPGTEVEIIDQPRIRSWAEIEGEITMAGDSPSWYETAVALDEALFDDGGEWIVDSEVQS